MGKLSHCWAVCKESVYSYVYCVHLLHLTKASTKTQRQREREKTHTKSTTLLAVATAAHKHYHINPPRNFYTNPSFFSSPRPQP